jgi:hypothetical protein
MFCIDAHYEQKQFFLSLVHFIQIDDDQIAKRTQCIS